MRRFSRIRKLSSRRGGSATRNWSAISCHLVKALGSAWASSKSCHCLSSYHFVSKTSSHCTGYLIHCRSLAMAELYITIATVFSRFDFELFETDESDNRMKHAYLVPYPKWESKNNKNTKKKKTKKQKNKQKKPKQYQLR